MTTDHPSGPLASGDSRSSVAEPLAILHSALVDGIARRRRRSRFRLTIAASATAAAASVALAGGLFSQGPPSALAIDTDDGHWIEVRILDGAAGAQEMTGELQDAGINAEVRSVPASPELVGHWMGAQQVDQGTTPDAGAAASAPALDQNEGFVRDDLIGIRSDAISKLRDTHWVYYVGRVPLDDEQPQEITSRGPS